MKNKTTEITKDYSVAKEKLKALYAADDTIPALIRAEERQEQSIDEYYVNLQMVIREDKGDKYQNALRDKVGGEKQAIGLKQMFEAVDDNQAASKLFVMGEAGVGKTTLMHSISYKWANDKDKLWQGKFDFVIRVRLKEMLNQSWKSDYDITQQRQSLLSCFIDYCLYRQKENIGQRDFFTYDEIQSLLDNCQDKLLLLVDGYDEIASLENDSNYELDYNRIIVNGILRFPNIIMTSRPSAVNDSLLDHFERTIVNNGLDLAGVNQYAEYFFRNSNGNEENTQNLQKFLKANPNIMDMCRVPINIGLICMIWEEPRIQDELKEKIDSGTFKAGQLYENIIGKLTKRHLERNKDNTEEADNTIESLESILPRMPVVRAIKDLAYYHITGGNKALFSKTTKLSNKDNNTAEFSGGASGITGKLLCGYINKHYKGSVKASEVIKFGLLSSEGNSKKIAKQTHYFVHLTFKEYLTAYHLYEYLLDRNELINAQMAAKLIAENRNNPAYIEMLKFLAGMVSDNQGDNNVALPRFWEAVSCNLEGVVELGVETKVELFMHLLSQSKVSKSEFDTRIPNLKEIIGFIDEIIAEQGLAEWQDRIVETGYMSPGVVNKIVEIIKPFIDGKVDNDIHGAVEKFHEEIKAAFSLVARFINDNSITEHIGSREEIFTCLLRMLETEAIGWQMKKFAIKQLGEIVDASIDDKTIYDVGKLLTGTFIDDNLHSSAVYSYGMLLKYSSDGTGMLTKQLAPLLRGKNWLAREAAAEVISKIAAGNAQVAQDTINSLALLLRDEERDEDELARKAAVDTIVKIAAGNEQIAQEAINSLVPLLRDGGARGAAAYAIGEIAGGSSLSEEVGQEVINNLALLLQDKHYMARYRAAEAIGKIVGGNEQVAQEVINNLALLLQDKHFMVNYRAAEAIGRIAAGNEQVAQETINSLIPLLRDKDWLVRKATVDTIGKIAVGSSLSEQVAQDTINSLALLLQDKHFMVNYRAADAIGKIAAGNEQVAQETINSLIPLLRDKDWLVRGAAVDTIGKIAAGNEQVAQDTINSLALLLQDKNRDARKAAAEALGKIAEGSSLSERVAHETINGLVPLLRDEEVWTRKVAAEALGNITAGNSLSEQVVQETIDSLVSLLLRDKDEDVRKAIVDTIGKIAVGSSLSEQVAQETINSLIPLLRDAKVWTRKAAAEALGKIAEGSSLSERVAHETINGLVPLLRDEEVWTRKVAAEALGNITAGNSLSEQVVQETIDSLVSLLLRDKDEDVRKAIVDTIGKIAVGSSLSEQVAQETINGLVPLLLDIDVEDSAAEALGKIAAGNEQVAQETINRLALLLQDEHPMARYGAAEAIGKIAASTPEIAYVILQHDDAFVRSNTYKLLLQKFTSSEELPARYKDLAILFKIVSVCVVDEAQGQVLLEAINKLIKSIIDEASGNEERLSEIVVTVNNNFADLPNSKYVNLFLKQLCHYMLEDGNIDEVKAELIIKCITERNITATFRMDEKKVIFEGHTYKIDASGKSSDNLEHIVNEVIKNSRDVLADQYRNNKPLFVNSESILERAATDIKASSMVSGENLSNDQWKLSVVYRSDSNDELQQVFLLFESRDYIGKQILGKIHIKDDIAVLEKYVKFHPNRLGDFRQVIFGELDAKEISEDVYRVLTFDEIVLDEELADLVESCKGQDIVGILDSLLSRIVISPNQHGYLQLANSWEALKSSEIAYKTDIYHLLDRDPPEGYKTIGKMLQRMDDLEAAKEEFSRDIKGLNSTIQKNKLLEEDEVSLLVKRLKNVEESVKKLPNPDLVNGAIYRVKELSESDEFNTGQFDDLFDMIKGLQKDITLLGSNVEAEIIVSGDIYAPADF